MFNAVKKALNNIYEYEYKPTVLVADDGDQITNGLHDKFDHSCNLFFDKWADEKCLKTVCIFGISIV